MPTLIGAAVLAAGGLVVWRLVRREWVRVNADLESQRATPRQPADAKRLEKDPETGTYRPADD